MHLSSALVVSVFVFCMVCVAVNSMRLQSKLEQSSNLLVSDQEVQRRKHEKNETVNGEVIVNQGDVTTPEYDNCGEDCVVDEREEAESRGLHDGGKRKKKKKQQDLMSRILPMMIIPFMVQTAMIPMALTALKFMLLKSAFIGKLAIILGLLNALRRRQNNGGVYSHNINIGEDTKKLHQEHYGYYGAPEYGAWINR